jgi:predicted RNA-binding protein YlqC (UPF0109 family)
MHDEAVESMKRILHQMVTSMVDYPDEIAIASQATERHIRLVIVPASSDFGILIGRSGRHARALRHLMGEISRQNGRTCDLQIVEPVPTDKSGSEIAALSVNVGA